MSNDKAQLQPRVAVAELYRSTERRRRVLRATAGETEVGYAVRYIPCVGGTGSALLVGAVWYWRRGHDSSPSRRRAAALLVGAVYGVNGLANSIWLGVLSEGSLERALTPLGCATVAVSVVFQFSFGLVLCWAGALLLRRIIEGRSR